MLATTSRMSDAWGMLACMNVQYDCGEFEFTDFHAHSPETLDIRVFDQSKWWVDRKATPHLLSEMSDEYRANILEWLVTHREMYFKAVARRRWIEILFRVPITPVAGSQTSLPPCAQEWLLGTELFQFLDRTSS